MNFLKKINLFILKKFYFFKNLFIKKKKKKKKTRNVDVQKIKNYKKHEIQTPLKSVNF